MGRKSKPYTGLPNNSRFAMSDAVMGVSPMMPDATPYAAFEVSPVLSPDGPSQSETENQTSELESLEASSHPKHAKKGKLREVKGQKKRYVIVYDTTSTEDGAESSTDAQSATTDDNQKKGKGKKSQKKQRQKNKETTSEPSTEAQTTTDNETSEAPSGQDESSAQTTDAETTTDQTTTTDPGWSMSEDCLLKSMKEGGETWANISNALNKGKKDVRARWNIIKDRVLETESEAAATADDAGAETSEVATTAAETSEVETSAAETSEVKTSAAETSEVATSAAETSEVETSGVETEEEEKAKGKGKGKQNAAKNQDNKPNTKAGNKNKEPPIANGKGKQKGKGKAQQETKWHKGTRNKKVASETKAAKAKAEQTTADLPSSCEASSEPSSSSSSSGAFIAIADKEQRRSNRYLYKHVQSALYPPLIHPKPDAAFPKGDCELLAVVHSKYQRNKYLEMQANFFNVTGRMIPVEAIQRKCEEAEREEERQREREKKRRGAGKRELEQRLQKVEKWVKHVAKKKKEKEDDPESSSSSSTSSAASSSS